MSRARRLPRAALLRASILAAVSGSCRSGEEPPLASFLVMAGDSTFWVESDGATLATRRSPLMLARVDGRFHEVYVVDEDLSYFDALLVGQRTYRRDIISGDSALVRYDSSIAHLAHAYGASHPRERQLDPDEETAEDPTIQATTDTELVDVIGPYLSYEFHLDVDIHGERDQHVTQRGVADIRDGRRMRVEDLVGPEEAQRAYAEGLARFTAALDSIRRAKDERATRARLAIAGFEFDSSSYELVEGDTGPAIAFLVPGRGPRAGGYALPLGEIPLGAPPWWRDVASALPSRSDGATAVWADTLYDITVSVDSGGATASLEVRRGTTRWPGVSLPIPVRRIFRLGTAPDDTVTRRALARAFDEAEAYAGAVRTAADREARSVAPPARRARPHTPPSRTPTPWPTRPRAKARASSPT
jgi:hypothetical protein